MSALGSDGIRWEVERVAAMGREPVEPHPPRLLAIARAVDPEVWSPSAQDGIDHGVRSGRTEHTTSVAGLLIMRRRLSIMRAADALRAVDRLEAGLPDRRALDARHLSDAMVTKASEMDRLVAPRGRVENGPSREVSFLKDVDGLPTPAWAIDDRGAVVLTWNEDGRTVALAIAVDRTATLTVGDDAPAVMDLHSWSSTAPAAITAAVDWVHHGSPRPAATIRPEGTRPS